LIYCLKGPETCALDRRSYDFDVIKKELAARKHPDLIIAAYKQADDGYRYLLIQTLWLIDDPTVETFMRSIAFEHPHEGIDDGSSVFALDYLAQSCDLNALALLNGDVFKKYAVMGCSYLKDSVEPAWADAVEAFGRCNYVPAAQNLARSLNSIYHDLGCLESDKAEQSLKLIFPGYCSDAHSTEEKQQCYEQLLQPKAEAKDH